jgi:DNA (cytosine-5)-methyltransferase 1
MPGTTVTGAHFMHDLDASGEPRLRIGSLFSGYGGLDLAVEHVFNAKTAWFSELNEPVARVFSHHWPDAPNLGDITTIDALQPEWVVIENVRGLLSSPATRPPAEGADHDRRNPGDATPDDATLRILESDPSHLGDNATRPLRALGAVLGDLADLRLDARWIGLPASLVGAPRQRFRIFALARRTVPHPAGDGLIARRGDPRPGANTTRDDRAVAPDHRLRPSRTEWLTQQESRIGDPVFPDRRTVQRWGCYAPAIARWEQIIGRAAPTPALLTEIANPRPAPPFVEWLMGLPAGWVTGPAHGLTDAQQLTALGNGVVPAQAVHAVGILWRHASSIRV